MRKTAFILASAAAFDLGALAVSAQAQQGTREPTAPAGPAAASQTRAVDMFLKIDRVNSVQACTARRGEVVRHEGGQRCRLPAPGDADIHKQSIALNYTKIDIHYTARTCIAQRGEVVTRDGIQQCALPAGLGDDRLSPPQR